MDSITRDPKCPFQEPVAKKTRIDTDGPGCPYQRPAASHQQSPPPPAPSTDLPQSQVGSVNIAPSLEPDEDHRHRMEESLRHFDVLDEVQGDQSEASDAEAPDGDDFSSDTDLEGDATGVGNERKSHEGNDDLDEDALEELLNEGLPESIRNKKVEVQYDEKFKTVLDEFEQNHFEVLPEGWVQVTHNSGMPLFLHTASRVCSASQPYFLGPGSVRKHEIPITAVPCLSYRRSLNKEELRHKQQQVAAEANANTDPTTAALLPIATQAVIETARENLINESLTPDQMNEYCRTLFRFKKIRVMRFKSWQARRKFTKSKKHIKSLHRPTLPDGTKLISFPIHHHSHNSLVTTSTTDTNGLHSAAASTDDTGSGSTNTAAQHNTSLPRQRREWIMNPNGKSYVCILHEYVQHALKKQPTYEFKELENAATPYSATVSINDLKYGTGFGTSKKQAKSEAARETLEVLIPEMRDKITVPGGDKQPKAADEVSPMANAADADPSPTSTDATATSYNKDVSVFDEIRIEDPRVTEFCSKTTEPLPHAILLTCLQRNYGLGEVQISYQVNTTKHKRNEFTMTVGKHSVTVACKNKRDGKHRAAQAILQTLHPHVRTWGSLLRLYGNHSVKSFKEKKQEELQITVLQSKAAINQPNYAILDKLRLEMTKLMERRASVRPIGTFQPPLEMELPSSSAANLKNVEL